MSIKNHPKSIWYWIGSERFWYLPYIDTPVRIKKGLWSVAAGGTDVTLELDNTRHILFYGVNESTGTLPLTFLAECADYRIGISIHRNHVAEPMIFYPIVTTDRHDLLSTQILHRENAKNRAYIARTLIKWQWHQRNWLCPSTVDPAKLAATRSHVDVMQLEARAARDYWEIYFRKLGLVGTARRSEHPVCAALDATSHFLAGITLRWILTHGLSPAHGYLHQSSSYPGLVYDLMEITRWISEKAVFDAYIEGGDVDIVRRSIVTFKSLLDEKIHSEPTRQNIYRRTLIHGNVIALRHYLEGRMKHYLPAVEESPKARGRKRLTSYTLPGEIWS